MKKKAAIVIIALIAILSIFFVIMIEKNMKTPVERFLETSQMTSKAENYVPVKILMDNKNIQYEFLSYDLIDDKDIVKQTKSKAEYFIEGKVPPADYVVKWTNFDAMARDYPKFDEYRKSNGEKGMTDAEYDEFMRIHKPEYTIDKHIKTKYLFVRCRITYTGAGRDTEWLAQPHVFAMQGDSRALMLSAGASYCYFDHPQKALWEDGNREDFFWYKFEKEGESLECILGIRLRGDRGVDLSKDNSYYIGFEPVGSDDEDNFNPAIDARCVSINDMPREKEA